MTINDNTWLGHCDSISEYKTKGNTLASGSCNKG